MMVANIRVTEDNGQHFVRIDVDGDALTPRGPFGSADEAEIAAVRIAGICKVFNTQVHWAEPTAVAQRER